MSFNVVTKFYFYTFSRGVEPYAFHPLGNEFKVTSSGGAVFEEDVDLSEGDWGDYDEENDAAVGVNEFESKIISA